MYDTIDTIGRIFTAGGRDRCHCSENFGCYDVWQKHRTNQNSLWQPLPLLVICTLNWDNAAPIFKAYFIAFVSLNFQTSHLVPEVVVSRILPLAGNESARFLIFVSRTHSVPTLHSLSIQDDKELPKVHVLIFCVEATDTSKPSFSFVRSII